MVVLVGLGMTVVGSGMVTGESWWPKVKLEGRPIGHKEAAEQERNRK